MRNAAQTEFRASPCPGFSSCAATFALLPPVHTRAHTLSSEQWRSTRDSIRITSIPVSSTGCVPLPLRGGKNSGTDAPLIALPSRPASSRPRCNAMTCSIWTFRNAVGSRRYVSPPSRARPCAREEEARRRAAAPLDWPGSVPRPFSLAGLTSLDTSCAAVSRSNRNM